jgi:hypothetical protein
MANLLDAGPVNPSSGADGVLQENGQKARKMQIIITPFGIEYYHRMWRSRA